MVVQGIEPLGRETLVRGVLPAQGDRHPPQAVIAIAPPHMNIQGGDRLPLQFDPATLFLFDLATGVTLYPPPAHCRP